MAYCNKRLILASGSPRRRELLDKFGINYEILPAQGEESAPPELTPGERVKALAAQKAEEVAQRLNDPAAVILAADTLVELDGEVLGKPGTAERAQAMLRALSGREHRVWSGVCIREGESVPPSISALSPMRRSMPTSPPASRSTRRALTAIRGSRVSLWSASRAISST